MYKTTHIPADVYPACVKGAIRRVDLRIGGALFVWLLILFGPNVRAGGATSQETFDNMFCIQRNIYSACYHGAAQKFTAELTGYLSWVELPMSRADFTTQALIVQMRSDSPEGALLAVSNPVVASSIPIGSRQGPPDNYAWIRFTFPTPMLVTAGDTLVIVIPHDPLFSTPDPAWGWGKADSNLYPKGVAYGGVSADVVPPNGRWDRWQDGSDFAFRAPVSSGLPPTDLTAILTATPTAGSAPLTVDFTCRAGSPNGPIKRYLWDIDNDGVTEYTTTTGQLTHTYDTNGVYRASVTVFDSADAQVESATIRIKVGDGAELSGKVEYFLFNEATLTVTTKVRVYNTGNAAAGAFTVTLALFDTLPSDGTPLKTVTVPTGLGAGQNILLTVKKTLTESVYGRNLSLVIDDAKQVQEVDETNNGVQMTLRSMKTK